jgi:hypothetical protein
MKMLLIELVTEMSIATEKLPVPQRDVRKQKLPRSFFQKMFQISLP